MKKFAKMAALLMSAVMCAFTSCGDGSGDKHEDDIAKSPVAQFALVTDAETQNNVEGTVTVEFQPSGKSMTVKIGDVNGALDKTMEEIIGMTSGSGDFSKFLPTSRSVKYELKGESTDTKCVITPNIKAKAGMDFAADKTYAYRLLIPYNVVNSKGVGHMSTYMVSFNTATGDNFVKFCSFGNITETIELR